MALLNKLDAPTTTAQLTGWLAGKLPRAEDIAVTDVDIPQAAGMSMTTILFKAGWTEDGAAQSFDLVARVAPVAPGVFKDPDLRREYEVLSLMAQGFSNFGIAARLVVTVPAVERHVTGIFAKLKLDQSYRAQHRRVSAVLAFLNASE